MSETANWWDAAPIVEQPASQGNWWEAAPLVEQPGAWDTVKDVAASAASGVARGTADLVGLPGSIQNAFDSSFSAITGIKAPPPSPLSGSQLRETASDLTGGATDYKPETTAGEYASTVGEFVPGAVALGGLSPINLAKNAVLPAVGSEAAGQATEGTVLEPYARVAGAIAGGVAPSIASRAVTPFPISAERAAANQVMKDEGVALTAGQKTGSVNLRNVESELGGGAAATKAEQQGEQFTRAALKRAGIEADRATPEVIDGAFNRIGKQFDDLAERNRLRPDKKFSADLSKTMKEYNELVPESARAPVIENTIVDMAQMAKDGLSGEAYQAIRSRLDKAGRSAGNDPQLSDALYSLRNSMDEAMERSIERYNPDDLGKWKEARRDYRNMLVIEKAATGPGEAAAMGIISPSKLRQVAAQQNRRAYARGKGDFADLARAGEATMKPLPNSGTAGRQAARNLFTMIPTALGGAGGGLVGGIPGAIAGAVAGTAAPAVAGRLLLSKPASAYFANQLLPATGQVAPALAGAGLQGVAHETAEQGARQRWPHRLNTTRQSRP